MYAENENEVGLECTECGLKIDEIEFIDYRCRICFVNDELKCILCHQTDGPDFFINYMCESCFCWSIQ